MPKTQSICTKCKKRKMDYRGKNRKGDKFYRNLCKRCHGYSDRKKLLNIENLKKLNLINCPYRLYKKSFCEKCGFIPEHLVQLDVDHIDGNHRNNNEENLMTLCANCHRFKTWKNRDIIKGWDN